VFGVGSTCVDYGDYSETVIDGFRRIEVDNSTAEISERSQNY